MKRTRTVLATLAATTGLLLLAAPAQAHDDQTNIALESDLAADAGPLSLDLRVSLRYSGDDHLVEDATVTVSGTGPDGATLAATPMEPVAETVGLWGAALTFPRAGTWTLQVTSTDPDGELTVDVDVAEGDAAQADAGSADDEPTPTTTEPDTDEGLEQQAEDDGDLLPIVLGTLAVLLVGGAVAALVLRRRNPAGGDSPDDLAADDAGTGDLP